MARLVDHLDLGRAVIAGGRLDLDLALVNLGYGWRCDTCRDGLDDRLAREDRLHFAGGQGLCEFVRVLLVAHFLRGEGRRCGGNGDHGGRCDEAVTDFHVPVPLGQRRYFTPIPGARLSLRENLPSCSPESGGCTARVPFRGGNGVKTSGRFFGVRYAERSARPKPPARAHRRLRNGHPPDCRNR